MTTMQTLLGNILRNRINAELKKDVADQNFTEIQEIMDIFLAGNKITAEQYAEFTDLITPIAQTTNTTETNTTTENKETTDTTKTA